MRPAGRKSSQRLGRGTERIDRPTSISIRTNSTGTAKRSTSADQPRTASRIEPHRPNLKRWSVLRNQLRTFFSDHRLLTPDHPFTDTSRRKYSDTTDACNPDKSRD